MEFKFEGKTHTYTLDGKRLTGVTTVLGVIAKPALIGWAAKEAVRVLGWYDKKYDNVEEGEQVLKEVFLRFNEIDSEGYYNLLDKARKAHTKKKEKAAQAGTDIHAFIEAWIKDNETTMPVDSVAFKQADQFIDWVNKNKVKFLESEKIMYSEKMWLGGTVDAVAEIDGKKYVVDFKTQAKMWDQTPFLQTAAYQMMLEEMGEKDFHGSLVLLLPKGGKLEEHYDWDLETNKKGFMAALELYRTLNSK